MTDDRFTEALVAQGEAELALCLKSLSEHGILPAQIPAAGLCVPDFGTMRSLIIHRRANGWAAYILFAGVAPGAPDVIGTPDSMAAVTQDGARFQGCKLIARLVLMNLCHQHGAR